MDITVKSFELNSAFVEAQERLESENASNRNEPGASEATFKDILKRIIEPGQNLDIYI